MKSSMKVIVALTLAVSALFAPEVRADDDTDPTGVVVMVRKKIVDSNRLKPLQNPRYERSEEIVKRHVSDSKNKIVGEVDDVIFGIGGQVKALYVDFDRLNLKRSVYINHSSLDINSTTSGYRLGLTSEEIEELYPRLLSDIETAAGDIGGNYAIYSLNSVLGRAVVDSEGRSIGKLEDILFDSDGTYVRSAYLNINFRTVRNKGVAVPLSILDFEEKDGKVRIVIAQPYVDPILEMAKDN